jgi:hypothetical protein
MTTPESSSKTTELLSSINDKLNHILAVLVIQDRSADDQISALRGLGHDWTTIGKLVGLKPDAARMRFNNRKKKGG